MAKVKRTVIYMFEINGLYYIGSTRQDHRARWNKHRSEMLNGNHHSQYVQQAFDSIREMEGIDGVHFEILEDMGEDVPESARLRRERYYIGLYRATLNEAYLKRVGPDMVDKRGKKVDIMAWELQQMQDSF